MSTTRRALKAFRLTIDANLKPATPPKMSSIHFERGVPTMPNTAYGRMMLQSRNEPVDPKPTDLAEALEQVRHLYLNLSAEMNGKTKCTRPDLSVWAAADEDMPPAIVHLSIAPTWGQQQRGADFTPDEARALAQYLNAMADLVDREVDQWISRKVVELAP